MKLQLPDGITWLDVVEHVRKEAENNPDKVASCVYAARNDEGQVQPECIVGAALVDVGVSVEALAQRLGQNVDSLIDGEAPYRVSRWLMCAQAHQDIGHTWSEAVAIADQNFLGIKEVS